MIETANLVGSISRKAGGLHDSVRRLVQCLASQGVGVQVLTLQDEFTEDDIHLWDPVHVNAFTSSTPRSFGYAGGFLRQLDRYKPDLIHTHGTWQYPSVATAKYCYRNTIPYMISPHGMLDPWAINHHRWKKAVAFAVYEQRHLTGARCLRALCESEAASIRKLGISNAIAIIPNGIDLPAPNVGLSGSNANPFAPFLGNNSSKRVMLYLGRIHPKKGLVNLLRAWKEMLSKTQGDRRHDWLLAIAGWDQGGHEDELKKMAMESGISLVDARQRGIDTNIATLSAPPRPDEVDLRNREPCVVFMGPQFGNDKAACYANCDAFILPSFSEGLPMVVLEAWAYGKPVVMTPECNLPEGYAAGAALSITTDTTSISDCLCKLTDMHDEELRSVGNRGRDLVVQRFTWSSIATQMKKTYEWMLGGTPRPNWTTED